MGHSEKEVVLNFPDGRTLSLPFMQDSAGNEFIDIRRLQPESGICTYDPGFTSTASCKSAITYTDGIKGILLYRGYDLKSLAEDSNFVDCAFLVLFGDKPSKTESEEFATQLKRHTLLHQQLIHFYQGFKHDAHPMAILVGVVGALSSFYHADIDLTDPKERKMTAIRLIAKMPTIAAIAYKTSIGQPIMYPKNKLTYIENFLHMLFAIPSEDYKVDPVFARALEVIFILHMDHEQNASTSTVRTAGSSQANPYACIASGIAALWGPAHGGANEAVLRMLTEIGTVDNIPKFIARAKDKSDPFRLMGFGHRIYKTYDPRSVVLKELCHTVLKHTGNVNDPILQVAMELEKVALEDEYFIKRHLYPNLDFYSGIVLRAIGIPISMFTVLFAVARTVGWVAQWMEMAEEPISKISRPRQFYIGHMKR
eukprot:g8429.t1